MRRPLLLPTTLALALATAGVLTSAAWLLPAAATVEAPGSGEGVARRFYAAVNAAIATGDMAPLRATVAPDFSSTDALPGAAMGRADLEAVLADVHATAPRTRVEVEAIVAAGGRVMARLAVGGDRAGSFLRLPVAVAPAPWGAVDVLRIREGLIAERTGLAVGTGLLRPLQAASFAFAGPMRRVVTLERVTVPAGARHDVAPSFDSQVLLADTGTVRVEDAAAATDAALSPGVMLVVPANTRVAATNRGETDATLLRLSLVPPWASAPDPDPAAEATTVRPLAGGVATLLPAGPLEVAVGRVRLGPGATLALDGGTGVALVAVAAGQVGIAGEGALRVRRGADGSGASVESATLDPGDGVLVNPGTPFVLRNDGSSPAEALLVVVVGSIR